MNPGMLPSRAHVDCLATFLNLDGWLIPRLTLLMHPDNFTSQHVTFHSLPAQTSKAKMAASTYIAPAFHHLSDSTTYQPPTTSFSLRSKSACQLRNVHHYRNILNNHHHHHHHHYFQHGHHSIQEDRCEGFGQGTTGWTYVPWPAHQRASGRHVSNSSSPPACGPKKSSQTGDWSIKVYSDYIYSQ